MNTKWSHGGGHDKVRVKEGKMRIWETRRGHTKHNQKDE